MDNSIIYYKTLEAANKIEHQNTHNEEIICTSKKSSQKSYMKIYGIAALLIIIALTITIYTVATSPIAAGITGHLV